MSRSTYTNDSVCLRISIYQIRVTDKRQYIEVVWCIGRETKTTIGYTRSIIGTSNCNRTSLYWWYIAILISGSECKGIYSTIIRSDYIGNSSIGWESESSMAHIRDLGKCYSISSISISCHELSCHRAKVFCTRIREYIGHWYCWSGVHKTEVLSWREWSYECNQREKCNPTKCKIMDHNKESYIALLVNHNFWYMAINRYCTFKIIFLYIKTPLKNTRGVNTISYFGDRNTISS